MINLLRRFWEGRLPYSKLLKQHGFRAVNVTDQLVEWEKRVGDIGWRVMLSESGAGLHAYIINENGHLLPCGGMGCEPEDLETRLLPTIRQVAALEILRQASWRDLIKPGDEAREVLKRVNEQIPPWRSTVEVPVEWTNGAIDYFSAERERLEQLLRPTLEAAGFRHHHHWILENGDTATILKIRLYPDFVLSATAEHWSLTQNGSWRKTNELILTQYDCDDITTTPTLIDEMITAVKDRLKQP